MVKTVNPEVWSKKVFSSGWSDGGGGSIEIREPATGDLLGEVGSANPADVAQATRKARAAQPDWAAHPLAERAPAPAHRPASRST